MARTDPASSEVSASARPDASAALRLSERVRPRQHLLYRLCSTTLARLGWTFRDRNGLANPWT